MLKIEDFKKETIDIPFLVFVVSSIFYFTGALFDWFIINDKVLKLSIFVVLFDLVLFVLYKTKKLDYKFFSFVFLLTLFVLINFVFFFNTYTIYRSLWFITFLPFAYLYGGVKFGVFVSFYSFLVMLFSYFQGFLNITFQDYMAFFVSLIIVSIMSYLFVIIMKKFETKVLEERKKLDIQAKTDYLTGVYNRRGFMEEIKGKKGVIGIFDLDYFKNINDTFGHDFGDEYLVFFVKFLKSSIRKDDVIGRFGGDEFVVLFKNAKKEDLTRWIKNFYENLENLDFKNLKISVSTGFASYEGDIKKSLHLADKALYTSKIKRNQFTFCEG